MILINLTKIIIGILGLTLFMMFIGQKTTIILIAIVSLCSLIYYLCFEEIEEDV